VISFVVPAHNEERLISATLDAIHAAARELARPYELIVVDDASTDATAGLAREKGARVVACEHRQIARVRNTGARASTGDILIFVDADTLISAAVVRASVEALAHGAVGGGATLHVDGRLPWWGPAAIWLVGEGMGLMRWAAGCYVFCMRAAFDATGGFDEALFATEEIAFSRALKRLGPVVILRERVVTSGRKMRTHSLREFLPVFGGVFQHGTAALRSRDKLSVWYGERRDEP
jgi:glycosyltransferase involved in cell wall biosynthesis